MERIPTLSSWLRDDANTSEDFFNYWNSELWLGGRMYLLNWSLKPLIARKVDVLTKRTYGKVLYRLASTSGLVVAVAIQTRISICVRSRSSCPKLEFVSCAKTLASGDRGRSHPYRRLEVLDRVERSLGSLVPSPRNASWILNHHVLPLHMRV